MPRPVPKLPTWPARAELDAGVARRVDPSSWGAVREEELREIERERALRHLLLELGALCARATHPEELVRGVLQRLVIGLDLAAAWVAVPARGAEDTLWSSFGPLVEADDLRAFGRARGHDAGFTPVRVPPAETAALPDREARGEGIFVRFRVQGPDHGWLLLVAGEREAVPVDVDDLLPAAAGLLGGSLARIAALASLRRLNRQLEVEVARRTADLVREKESLEARVRERTLELERAKRAVLDSERRLLDLERRENVRQLAAGVAHELNNPLGAVSATMDFVREEIAELVAGQPLPAEALIDLREAVTDVRTDLTRMSELVTGLFGETAAQRRAAVRTPLDDAVLDAIRHFRRGAPPGALIEVQVDTGAYVGIPAGELTRWVFRLLSSLLGTQGGAVRVETRNEDGSRAVHLEMPGRALTASETMLEPLADEIESAGGRMALAGGGDVVRIRVDLPPACGDAGGMVDREDAS